MSAMMDAEHPGQLTLEDLITRLEAEDPAKVVKVGFGNPHSYRGHYEQLAFEVTEDVSVGEMLGSARSALGTTYQGWKGGDFDMTGDTEIWLVREEGQGGGETLGNLLLTLMLAESSE